MPWAGCGCDTEARGCRVCSISPVLSEEHVLELQPVGPSHANAYATD